MSKYTQQIFLFLFTFGQQFCRCTLQSSFLSCNFSSCSSYRLTFMKIEWMGCFYFVSVSVLHTFHIHLLFISLICFVGMVIPAVLMVTIKYVNCSQSGALTLVILAVAFSAFSQAGYNVNHLDIAPNFAGKCGFFAN